MLGKTGSDQVPLASQRRHHKCANNQDPHREGGTSAEENDTKCHKALGDPCFPEEEATGDPVLKR